MANRFDEPIKGTPAALLAKQVDRIQRAVARLEAAREEAITGHRKIQEGISAQEKIIQTLREDLELLDESLSIFRQGSSQIDYVAGRLEEMSEDFSEMLNEAIDNVIRRPGGELDDTSETRLRDAIEGALEKPLRAVLAGITSHKRKQLLEMIIDAMIHEPIDAAAANWVPPEATVGNAPSGGRTDRKETNG